MRMECPVCGATTPRLRYRLSRRSVCTCRACGLVYLWPQPSEEEIRTIFDSHYSGGKELLPELRDYCSFTYDESPANPLVQMYERWLDEIERHIGPGNLADVGCGSGLFLHLARRRGWNPFGIDESSPAIAHARDHFGLAVEQNDFSSFSRQGRRFDVITMWDTLEHARRPLELVRAARGCLDRGGLLALATPNQANILDLVGRALYLVTAGRLTSPLEKFYIDPHFVYFTPATLAALLRQAGFEVVVLRQQATDLRRLTLGVPKRLALRALFGVARLAGRQTRLFAIARAA